MEQPLLIVVMSTVWAFFARLAVTLIADSGMDSLMPTSSLGLPSFGRSGRTFWLMSRDVTRRCHRVILCHTPVISSTIIINVTSCTSCIKIFICVCLLLYNSNTPTYAHLCTHIHIDMRITMYLPLGEYQRAQVVRWRWKGQHLGAALCEGWNDVTEVECSSNFNFNDFGKNLKVRSSTY